MEMICRSFDGRVEIEASSVFTELAEHPMLIASNAIKDASMIMVQSFRLLVIYFALRFFGWGMYTENQLYAQLVGYGSQRMHLNLMLCIQY